jgi:hypothetical protein
MFEDGSIEPLGYYYVSDLVNGGLIRCIRSRKKTLRTHEWSATINLAIELNVAVVCSVSQ